MAKISGLVAAILNDREIIINLGAEQSVAVGMKFKVLDQARQVKDPATGADLGVVRREKVKVKIVDVQSKLSIARTYETYEVNAGGSGGLLGGFSASLAELYKQPKIITRVRTLRYDDSGLGYSPLEEAYSLVKIGDPVELSEEDDSAG